MLDLIKPFLSLRKALYSEPLETVYEYSDLTALLKLFETDIGEGNYIHISELLGRAHQVAHLTLLRQLRWLDGIEFGFSSPNLFVFASSLRGFVEAAGDSLKCLQYVPPFIGNNYQLIKNVLAKRFTERPVAVKRLEDELIHFTHGRKAVKGETIEKMHTALSAAEYVSELDSVGETKAKDLYSYLCQQTHPAAASVLCFLVPLDSTANKVGWHFECENDEIAFIISRHRLVIEQAFQLVFNVSLLSLYCLNRLSDERFVTPQLANVDLTLIAGFKEWKSRFDELQGGK